MSCSEEAPGYSQFGLFGQSFSLMQLLRLAWALTAAAACFLILLILHNHILREAVNQEKQSFREPISWKYPEPPAEEQPKYPQDFQLKTPVAFDSVSAVCGANSVRVEAKKDLLGIGKPVRAAEVTLGGCPATGEDAQVLVFESELHGCGSELVISEDSFIYAFTLHHIPAPLGDSQIIRTREVTVSIQCQYQRKHDVSSVPLNPTSSPFSATKSSEETLFFSLRLMSDDWQSTHPSAQFLLGDMMKFEVSVRQFHHVPLRVMVDSCVATVIPNIDTVPRYAFLGNNGCLFDSQLTDSSSQFLPRAYEDRLQFQVEAFKFQQEGSGVIYITCNVRAAVASAAVDATNKACSFSNGWTEASGNHRACSCCDTDCRTGSHMTGSEAQWEQEKAVGPITVNERPQW
ncbi:zona pellucida sperm-binding protein 3-like [Notothenia coriiceps]|uniref:Zona pellucida sperm-binding protein 3 n=1 Tax=Notothenia coriiceps TaxID=8208 RepID=A0A6I9PQZ0_9TELE|nr:PREDICTED: zona pellucida sperm-binding protein 3-like [Notothenia coriiceps]